MAVRRSDRARRPFRDDESGVAGFQEEIPLLVIVIVSLALFIASLFNAYALYAGSQDRLRFRETAQDFGESIYSHRLLTGGDVPGRFAATSLSEDVRVKIEQEFHRDELGFQYNLTVQDVSDYPDSLAWFAGDDATDVALQYARDVRVITKPVSIADGDLTHAALLIIKVWR